MDFPVVLLKIRDYVLWLGPIYLLAIGLDAATEVTLRRLFNLSIPQPQPKPATQVKGVASSTKGSAPQLNLFLEIWWRRTGRPGHTCVVAPQLYVWSIVVSQSVSWLTLLLIAALSWPLSVMRIGFALILASLFALLVPLFMGRQADFTFQLPIQDKDVQPASVAVAWWRVVQQRFEVTSNAFLLGAGLGAGFIGLAPGILSMLRFGFEPPLSYLSGAILGVIVPLMPGMELPLLVAMQSRGFDASALAALMLGVTAFNWQLFRFFLRQEGPKVTALFFVLAALLAMVLAVPFAAIAALMGVF